MKEDLKALERENASLQKKIYKLKEAIASPSGNFIPFIIKCR